MIISVFDRVENIVGKGEIACTSNFSFSLNVFKKLLSQRRQEVSLCGNGLTVSQTKKNLDRTKFKAFAADKLDIAKMMIFPFDREENTVG